MGSRWKTVEIVSSSIGQDAHASSGRGSISTAATTLKLRPDSHLQTDELFMGTCGRTPSKRPTQLPTRAVCCLTKRNPQINYIKRNPDTTIEIQLQLVCSNRQDNRKKWSYCLSFSVNNWVSVVVSFAYDLL